MFKRLLRKILPPPVENVHRYIDDVQNSMEEQKELTYMLMQQVDTLSRQVAIAKGDACSETACLADRPLTQLQFEFSLAYHCNLNCAGCAHFSPLSKAEFPDFDEAERDFARLGQLFKGRCKFIHLMGGEPLLNPRVEDYLRMARKHFPIGDIQLVTNGMLLLKMSESFYQTCKEAKISIHVTPYPIRLDHKAIEKRCRRYGVPYHFYMNADSISEFNRYVIDQTGSQDVVENFKTCANSNYCLFLYKGRMYPCGSGTHFRIFNKYYDAGMELSDRDSVDIYKVKGGWELLMEMARPVPMCRYCVMSARKEAFEWTHSKKDIKEWT